MKLFPSPFFSFGFALLGFFVASFFIGFFSVSVSVDFIPSGKASNDISVPEGVLEGARDNAKDRIERFSLAAKQEVCALGKRAYELDLSLQENVNGWFGLVNVLNLFRNQCWRNTLWAHDDVRADLAQRQSDAWYLRCLLPDLESDQNARDRELYLEYTDQINLLQEIRDLYANNKFQLLFDKPDFGFGIVVDSEALEGEYIGRTPGDGLFEWLLPVGNFSGLFENYWRSVVRLATSDFAVPLLKFSAQFSDDVFSLILSSGYFSDLLLFHWNVWRAENDYKGFSEYIEEHESTIRRRLQEYAQELSRRLRSDDAPLDEARFKEAIGELEGRLREDRVLSGRSKEELFRLSEEVIGDASTLSPNPGESILQSAEDYSNWLRDTKRLFSEGLTTGIEAVDAVSQQKDLLLRQIRARTDLLRRTLPYVAPNDKEYAKKMEGLNKHRAALHYSDFLFRQVSQCGDTGLEELSQKIAETVEAITGISKGGSFGGRLGLEDRFDRAQERTLQRMCSQLEAMYRKTGRDLSALPRDIGSARGQEYCRAVQECPKEKTQEECAFEGLLRSIEVAPDPERDERRRSITEDNAMTIEGLRENLALLEVLEKRQQSYLGLRAAYQLRFGNSSQTQEQLLQALSDANTRLWNSAKNVPYDPRLRNANQVSLLQHVYQELWDFQNAIQEYCPMPRDPEG